MKKKGVDSKRGHFLLPEQHKKYGTQLQREVTDSHNADFRENLSENSRQY
jgi:hypothetical protein